MNTMHNDPVVIVGAARTPMGGFQGDFSSLAASDLGAVAIRAAVERAGVAPADVDKVIFGCVLPAGQGQAPARQAALKAGLPLASYLEQCERQHIRRSLQANGGRIAATADALGISRKNLWEKMKKLGVEP